jgi:hypothetical protein
MGLSTSRVSPPGHSLSLSLSLSPQTSPMHLHQPCIVAARRESRKIHHENKRRSVAEWHRQRALAAMHAITGCRLTGWSLLNPLLHSCVRSKRT